MSSDIENGGLRSNDVVVAKKRVQLLRRERQERREHGLDVVDAPERDIQDRSRALAILFDHMPWLLGAEVHVDLRGRVHGELQRCLEAGLSQKPGNVVEHAAVVWL